MQYMRSVQFIQDRKNWMSNVLMNGVCLLVPYIGQIVVQGYMFEVIDSLHRDPERQDYRDFDFNRFSEYLSRGIWPFLWDLIIGLIAMVPVSIVCAVVMVGAIAASKGNPAAILVAYAVFFALIFVVQIVIAFVTWPAELHSGLSRKFDFSAMWAFAKDFNRRVFKELFLAVLFLAGIGVVAYFVGLALFCIGTVFTMAAVVMAKHHLLFQLYELYLQRGGTPIPGAAGRSRFDDRAGPDPLGPEPEEPRRESSGDPDERFRAGP